MEILSRKQAHSLGLRKYFSGVPCKQGHIAERYVTTNGCVACLGSYKKLPIGPSRELRPFAPALVYVPDDMLPQLQDALNDHLMRATMAWVESLGMMTPGRWVGYDVVIKGVQQKRDVQERIANVAPAPLKTTATPRMPVPTVSVIPAAVVTDKRAGAQRFLNALATMTGAALDGATELIRQDGETDTAYRVRIVEKTKAHMGGA